jgi:hypothetical protein
MKTSYVYRKDKNGNVRGIPANQRMAHRPNEDPKTFEERIMRTMYDQEQQHGSRFRIPGYDLNTVRAVWTSDKINRETETNARALERVSQHAA